MTTYAALGVYCVAVGLALKALVSMEVPSGAMAAFLVGWIMLPSQYEVWMTATNAHWICAIAVLLVFLLPGEALRERLRYFVLLAVLCGLTGVSSSMLFPLFVLRGRLERSRWHLTIGLVLFATAGVQALVFLLAPNPHRAFSLDAWSLSTTVLLHGVLWPLFGADACQSIATLLLRHGGISLPWGAIVLSAGLLYTGTVVVAWSQARSFVVASLAAAWVGITVIQAFGSIGDQSVLLRDVLGGGGGRYFLFGNTCELLLLAIGAANPERVRRWIALTLLFAIGTVGLWGRLEGRRIGNYLDGPDWRTQVEDCVRGSPCQVGIWPAPWVITLP